MKKTIKNNHTYIEKHRHTFKQTHTNTPTIVDINKSFLNLASSVLTDSGSRDFFSILCFSNIIDLICISLYVNNNDTKRKQLKHPTHI